MVIWIIGLSGAGKSTLAEDVVGRVRKTASNVVLLDGDVIRATFGDDLGHDMASRRANSQRMMQMCKWLDGQGIHVVCAILSLFPKHRAELRDAVGDYLEVFIDAPLSDLQTRDVKGLYARYVRGETTMVAGLDLDFPRPEAPDLHIVNDGDRDALMAYAETLAQAVLSA